MEKHFTATAYIFHEGKILLHLHKKLKKWLPPGGHLEINETPAEAAVREAKEETGLDVELVTEENILIHSPNAISFPRPFLCLLESIPIYQDVLAHEHMDMIYIAKPIKLSDSTVPIKNNFHWFSNEELIDIEKDLFPDTKDIIKSLFNFFSETRSTYHQ